MKNLQYIEKPARKPLTFDYNDITKVLFFNEYPQFVDTPYRFSKTRVLAHLPLTFCIVSDDTSLPMLELLEKSICRVGLASVSNSYIFSRLTSWFVLPLVECYYMGSQEWKDYIVAEMENYCKTEAFSIFQWNVVKNGGFDAVLKNGRNVIHDLWISTNVKLEKENAAKEMVELRDSLLPWLNYEMWQSVEKREKNKHINVNFEAQRQKMFEGSFGTEKEEDLDIVT